MPALQTTVSSPPKVSIACCDHRAGGVPVAHVVAVDDRLATGRLDLLHDLGRRRQIGALAGERGAEVVDDDLGAVGRERERVRAAEAAAGARHDHDPSVADAHRSRPSLSGWCRGVAAWRAATSQSEEATTSACSSTVAEVGVEHAGALPEPLHVDLPREADPAVHLDARLARRTAPLRRPSSWRRRRVHRVVVAAPVERARRGVDAGPRDRGLHEHVGDQVLDRLERADRAAELLALLRVLGRQLDGAVGEAGLQARGETAPSSTTGGRPSGRRAARRRGWHR